MLATILGLLLDDHHREIFLTDVDLAVDLLPSDYCVKLLRLPILVFHQVFPEVFVIDSGLLGLRLRGVDLLELRLTLRLGTTRDSEVSALGLSLRRIHRLLTKLVEHHILLSEKSLDTLWVENRLLPLLPVSLLLLALVRSLLALASLELRMRLLCRRIEKCSLSIALGRSRPVVKLLLRPSLLILLHLVSVYQLVAIEDLFVEGVLVQGVPVPHVCEDARLRIVVPQYRPVQ